MASKGRGLTYCMSRVMDVGSRTRIDISFPTKGTFARGLPWCRDPGIRSTIAIASSFRRRSPPSHTESYLRTVSMLIAPMFESSRSNFRLQRMRSLRSTSDTDGGSSIAEDTSSPSKTLENRLVGSQELQRWRSRSGGPSWVRPPTLKPYTWFGSVQRGGNSDES